MADDLCVVSAWGVAMERCPCVRTSLLVLMWPMSAATPGEGPSAIALFGGSTWRWGLTGRETDVVEGELGDPGVELEQQRQRLANATGGPEHSDLGRLRRISVSMGLALGGRSSGIHLAFILNSSGIQAIQSSHRRVPNPPCNG